MANAEAEGRRERANKSEKNRQERINRINRNIDGNPTMENEDERAIVAERIVKILAMVKEKGVTKTKVAQEAGLGQGRDEDAASRLRTYQLPNNLKPEKRAKRVPKLAKKASRYREIARAAAKLAECEEKDHFLLEVFEGTTFDQREPLAHRETGYYGFAGFVEKLVRAIDKKIGLSTYFSEIARFELSRDKDFVSPDFYVIRPDLWWPSLADVLGQVDNFHWAIGLTPSVPLARFPEGEPVPITFRIAPRAEGRDETSDYRETTGSARTYCELRLGIAPADSTGRCVPVFERRYPSEFHADSGDVYVPSDPYASDNTGELVGEMVCNGEFFKAKLLPSSAVDPRKKSDAEHNARVLRMLKELDENDPRIRPLGDPDSAEVYSHVHYEPINPETCKRYLATPSRWYGTEPLLLVETRNLAGYVFPTWSLGALVEDNLYGMEKENPSRIDNMLVEDAKNLIQALADFRRRNDEGVADAHDKILSEWRATDDGGAK